MVSNLPIYCEQYLDSYFSEYIIINAGSACFGTSCRLWHTKQGFRYYLRRGSIFMLQSQNYNKNLLNYILEVEHVKEVIRKFWLLFFTLKRRHIISLLCRLLLHCFLLSLSLPITNQSQVF